MFKRRFETHDDQAKNPGEIREARRDIAKIRTIIRERELGFKRGATGITHVTAAKPEIKKTEIEEVAVEEPVAENEPATNKETETS
ncbi:MAG: 50S ribosomal protein L29 [Planctomycetota bacterium]